MQLNISTSPNKVFRQIADKHNSGGEQVQNRLNTVKVMGIPELEFQFDYHTTLFLAGLSSLHDNRSGVEVF